MLEIVSGSEDETFEEFNELCKALLREDPWDIIAPILKTLTSDPESVRYRVLDYAGKALLNYGGDVQQANIVISEFKDSFVESGKAGLYHACFESVSE
jgi:hypothetical protein